MQGGAGGRGDQTHGAGLAGQGALGPSSNSPSAPRRRLSSSKRRASMPSPAGCIDSMMSWIVAPGLIEGDPGLHQHLHAVLGAERHPAVVALNMAQRTWADMSFKEKYQWPELGIARLESSPVSHTSPRSCSRIMRTALLRRGDGKDLLLVLAGLVELIQGWPCCGVRRGGRNDGGHLTPVVPICRAMGPDR